jgi:hypothetical protein
MFFELKLKVDTAIVGDTYNRNRRVFEFPRDGEAWGLDLAALHTWDSLILNACNSLSLPHVHKAIRMPSTILLPTLNLLKRNKKPSRGKEGPSKTLWHEMIPRGTVITLHFMTREKDGTIDIPIPTHDELCQVFSFIGSYEGCSPFGSSAGYGRFRVQNLDVVGRTPFDLGQLSTGDHEGADLPGEENGNGELQKENRSHR